MNAVSERFGVKSIIYVTETYSAIVGFQVCQFDSYIHCDRFFPAYVINTLLILYSTVSTQ